MTWAVFLLYLEDRVSPADFAELKRLTTSQMQTGRHFQRFGAFADELLRLYHARTGSQHVPDLYPAVLDWAAAQ